MHPTAEEQYLDTGTPEYPCRLELKRLLDLGVDTDERSARSLS